MDLENDTLVVIGAYAGINGMYALASTSSQFAELGRYAKRVETFFSTLMEKQMQFYKAINTRGDDSTSANLAVLAHLASFSTANHDALYEETKSRNLQRLQQKIDSESERREGLKVTRDEIENQIYDSRAEQRKMQREFDLMKSGTVYNSQQGIIFMDLSKD